MSGARIYSNAVVRQVKAAVARKESIRSIAKRLGMSPSTVSNMSRGRIYSDKPRQRRHSKEHLDSIRDLSTTRAERLRAAKQAERAQLAKTTTLVEQAKAERDSGRPLVVETLEQRLARELPGSHLYKLKGFGESWWCVSKDARVLAQAASKREAIDKAVSLWGAR